jgi:hypothetical protein
MNIGKSNQHHYSDYALSVTAAYLIKEFPSVYALPVCTCVLAGNLVYSLQNCELLSAITTPNRVVLMLLNYTEKSNITDLSEGFVCCFGGVAYQPCSHEGLLYSSPQWSSIIHLQRRCTPSGVRDLC